MPEAPVQTYTFLFTDIEGSTRLWEQFPDAMHLALERHDCVLRSACERNQGIVFKTIGDAFCVAFQSPIAAVQAAGEAQLELKKTDFGPVGSLKVRMALYTGTARARDGDYFGTALNRVARLMAAGHGGQVLISAATHELVRGRMAEGFGATDLGSHQLRDLDRAESIFQLTHPDLQSDFPWLRSIDVIPNNLPRELTSFVGREREVSEVKSMLAKYSLVTLIGSGGCGKTRLALQVATDLAHRYDGGVWFVELAPLADPALVPQAIASALNVPEEQGQSILDGLKRYLKSQTTLVVLDNCEHLIGACAQTADALLRAAPNLKVLATSREALGVPGETAWKVPSLSVPDQDPESAADLLEGSESARLFVERAQAVAPAFVLTDAHAAAIAQVVRRLDGIPLAIELAAARVKALPVEQIATRLDDRFRLLTGGSRTALPRQQTLRAAIDWSYNLLGEGEKLLLNRLSVFTGGWTLEGAETVCAGDGIEDWETLDLLTQLVDKSLVVYEEVGSEARYRLLETVRQYAREKLFDSFDAVGLRRKHVAFFLNLAQRGERQLGGADQAAWLDRLDTDHDNFRAALEWSESDPDGHEDCLRLAKALGRFWEIRGYLTEGRSLMEKALSIAPKELEDLRMRALNQLGNILRVSGEFGPAQEAFNESLALTLKLGFKQGEAIVLNNLGICAMNLGRYEESRNNYERSIDICREGEFSVDLARALDNYAGLLSLTGQRDRARELQREALPIFRRIDDKRSISISLYSLADIARREQKLDEAAEYYQECLKLGRELAFKSGIASALEGIAMLSFERERHEVSARLYGAAAALRESIGSPLPPESLPEHEDYWERLADELGREKFVETMREGKFLGTDRAIILALNETNLAVS